MTISLVVAVCLTIVVGGTAAMVACLACFMNGKDKRCVIPESITKLPQKQVEPVIDYKPSFIPTERAKIDPELLDDLADWMEEIPPLPVITSGIVMEISKSSPSIGRLSEMLQVDPVLSAAMLRMANSAYVAPARTVTSVEHALMLLGTDTLMAVAVRSTMLQPRVLPTAFDHVAFWKHSAAASMFAGAIANKMSIDRGIASTAGLLHDIGRQLMYLRKPALIPMLLDEQSTLPCESFLEKEQKLFGVGHAVFGALLATRWRLPPILIDVIERHHEPLSDHKVIVVTFIANQLAKLAGYVSDEKEVVPLSPLYLQMAGDLQSLLPDLLPQIESSLGAFLEFISIR